VPPRLRQLARPQQTPGQGESTTTYVFERPDGLSHTVRAGSLEEAFNITESLREELGYLACIDIENDCPGHPAGPYDPMGQTVYCDGTCTQ
jgi:hypothetical protein